MKHCAIVFFLFISFSGICQINPENNPANNPNNQVDTLAVEVLDDLADEKNALYSAVLPGWGQIRNKQYMKAGTIFAAFGYGLVNTIDNTKDFSEIDDQYSELLVVYDPAVNTVDELILLENERQDIRDTKDIWTAATTYVYVGNLIDAAAQYKIIREDPNKHSATKAAYYSAILPGLGQVYNKKYWKVPLVYAALGTSLYIARENRNNHRDFQREIEFRAVGETTGFRPRLTDDRILENLEFWRMWRDAAYIATGVVYVLNIVDATVDAHLTDFNVDDELAIDVSPVFNTINEQPYYAVQFNIPINQ